MHALEIIAIRNAEASGRALGYAVNNNMSRAVTNALCREYVKAFKQSAAVRAAFERGYARGLREVK